jgi:hypothetical protein
VTTAVISLMFPYLHDHGLQVWNDCSSSTSLLLHVLLLCLGMFWCLHDGYNMLQSSIRSFCDNLLNKIVVDDILKSICDPQMGLVACWTGAIIGMSTMYGLKMTKEQRCTLVQSSLGLPNETVAHSVLLEPGGCKALLPLKIQKWLQQQQQQQPPATTTDVQGRNKNILQSKTMPDITNEPFSTPGDISIDTISTCCDGSNQYIDRHDQGIVFDGDTVRRARGLRFHYEDESPSSVEDDNVETIQQDPSQERPQQHSTSSLPEESHTANPFAVWATILKSIAHAKIKPYAEALPRSSVENVGMAAVAAVVAMPVVVRRSSQRHIVMGHVMIAAVLSSIAAVSFGSILARDTILGNVYDKQSMKLACRDMVVRILDKIKRNVLSNKAKSLLAMVILLLLQRKHPPPIPPSGRKSLTFLQ